MKILNVQRHGMLCQKVRAANTVYDKLKAIEEYEQFMDEIENDMFDAYKKLEANHLGKTAD